jgi:hypothetical protein
MKSLSTNILIRKCRARRVRFLRTIKPRRKPPVRVFSVVTVELGGAA